MYAGSRYSASQAHDNMHHKVRTYKEYHSVCPSSELGLPPTPHPQASVPPPPCFWGEGNNRWRERGWESPNSDEGRAYTVVLFICTYFVICTHESSTVRSPSSSKVDILWYGDKGNNKEEFLFPVNFGSFLIDFEQYCGFLTSWYGSGTADPCLWLMDPARIRIHLQILLFPSLTFKTPTKN